MRTVEFGELFRSIRNGLNVKQDKSGDGLPITRIETISTSTVDPLRVGFAGLTKKGYGNWLLRSGDVLFSHINSPIHVGRCAIYMGNPPELIHGMNLLCLRPDPTMVTSEYVVHLIRSPLFRSLLAPFVNKSVNQASVSIGNLKTIRVPLPPIEEQQRIAAILDQAEGLRAKRREAVAHLDDLTQSIFVDMFGDSVDVLELWPTKSLEEVATAIIDCPHSTPTWTESGEICLRTSNLTTGGWNWADTRFVSDAAYVERTRRGALHPGDIVLSREGTVGVAAIVQPGMRLCMGQRLVQVRANPNLIVPEFLLRFLLDILTPERIAHVMVGSTSRHVNVRDLRALRIPLPPTDLQAEFAKRMSAVGSLENINEMHLSKLDTTFSSLQSRAFSGEL